MKPLTLNGYAAHRRAKRLPGGSIRSVVEAVASGRIDVSENQMITDPAAADRAWEVRTDASKIPSASTNGHAHPKSLPEARRLESLERARGLKLANDLRAGQLIPLAAAQRIMAARVLEARNGWLSLVSKLRLHLPHLRPEDVSVIDGLIRETLEAMADGRMSLSPPRPGRRPPHEATTAE